MALWEQTLRPRPHPPSPLHHPLPPSSLPSPPSSSSIHNIISSPIPAHSIISPFFPIGNGHPSAGRGRAVGCDSFWPQNAIMPSEQQSAKRAKCHNWTSRKVSVPMLANSPYWRVGQRQKRKNEQQSVFGVLKQFPKFWPVNSRLKVKKFCVTA